MEKKDPLLTIDRRGFLQVSAAAALVSCSEPSAESEGPGPAWLVEEPQIRRDFNRDGRSKLVILGAHCILNQNARHVDCADFPAMMKPLVDGLEQRGIGIIQMPCPELMALGLGRDRDVPPLETIREALELPEAQERLEPLIHQIVYQIREYRFQQLTILGVLGKNGSPSCGVETTSTAEGQAPGEGVFITLLRKRLADEGLEIPVKGVDDFRQEESLMWVDDQLIAHSVGSAAIPSKS